jgi:hypothetical protein
MEANWKAFAEALDAFDGTGLGTGSYRVRVGTRKGKPLCRYCAVGAAVRSAAPNKCGVPGVSIATTAEDLFGGIGDAVGINDHFRIGDNSDEARRDRLAFMRKYARHRASGAPHWPAVCAATASRMHAIGGAKGGAR